MSVLSKTCLPSLCVRWLLRLRWTLTRTPLTAESNISRHSLRNQRTLLKLGYWVFYWHTCTHSSSLALRGIIETNRPRPRCVMNITDKIVTQHLRLALWPPSLKKDNGFLYLLPFPSLMKSQIKVKRHKGLSVL